MQVVILAGGLGTRMRHHMGDLPKALIPVHGRPFLAYQLKQLSEQGMRDIVLSVGYQGGAIRDYVGDGQAWGLRVTYSDEGQDLRGTGGALRYAQAQGLLAAQFGVLYGDSYLALDFAAVSRAFVVSAAPALLTVYANGDRYDTSNVICLEGGKIYYDKARRDRALGPYTHIDYGFSLFDLGALMAVLPSRGKADLGDAVSAMSARGQVVGFPVEERFYEIGSAAGLADFAAVVRQP